MVVLASARADVAEQAIAAQAEGWSVDLLTPSGYAFHVRPAASDDEAALAAFFTHVDREDLRFRFLAAIHKVSHDQPRDNHAAIELERERGWTASSAPGDPAVMVLRKTLDPRA